MGILVMALTVKPQIQRAVLAYLGARISLDEFRERFVPLSLNVERSKDLSAIQLAHRLDGVLGEASSAGWGEKDIRQELANVVRPLGHSKKTLSDSSVRARSHQRVHTER
jgi:hypothetical protein